MMNLSKPMKAGRRDYINKQKLYCPMLNENNNIETILPPLIQICCFQSRCNIRNENSVVRMKMFTKWQRKTDHEINFMKMSWNKRYSWYVFLYILKIARKKPFLFPTSLKPSLKNLCTIFAFFGLIKHLLCVQLVQFDTNVTVQTSLLYQP